MPIWALFREKKFHRTVSRAIPSSFLPSNEAGGSRVIKRNYLRSDLSINCPFYFIPIAIRLLEKEQRAAQVGCHLLLLLLVGGLAIFINLGAEQRTTWRSKSDSNPVVSYDCESRGPSQNAECLRPLPCRHREVTSLCSWMASFLLKVSIISNPLSTPVSTTIIYSLSSLAAACSCSGQTLTSTLKRTEERASERASDKGFKVITTALLIKRSRWMSSASARFAPQDLGEVASQSLGFDQKDRGGVRSRSVHDVCPIISSPQEGEISAHSFSALIDVFRKM